MEEKYVYNGKQTQSTRLEMLIAIKYLLDECSSSSKLSKATALTKYAEDNFKVNLDRRRVNQIFADLSELTTKYPDILPYQVIKAPNKPRYYIKKTLFNEREIKNISSSLAHDHSKTKAAIDKTIDSFLNKACSQEEKERYIKRLENKQEKQGYALPINNNIQNYIEDLCEYRVRFQFKLKNKRRVPSASEILFSRAILNLIRTDNYIGGIVYKIISTAKGNEVCIYLQDYKDAIIVKMENIEFHPNYKPVKQLKAPTFDLPNSKYSSIDDWLDHYYKGQTGRVQKIKFKFQIRALDEYKKKYEDYFQIPFVYTVEDREVKTINYEGKEETFLTQDVVSEVKCNFSSFENWYWSSGVFESVVILEPAYWNNRLLSSITKRFERRLEKYGETKTS